MGLFSKKTKEAPVQEKSEPIKIPVKMARAPRTGKITVYEAQDGWRWRMLASNGKIVADSGEAYKRRYDCHQAAIRFQDTAPKARVMLQGEDE